jgi:hypothetical protein
MRKNIIALSLLCAAVPMSAYALDLSSAVGGLAGNKSAAPDSAASGGDAVGQQDSLVKAYITANKEVLTAQYHMAKALGANEAAALAKAEAAALSSGATVDNLSKADSVQSDVSKAISERQNAAGNKMDAASKKEYSTGLASLGKGVLQYANMATKFNAFKNAITSASPMMMPKLSAGAYVVKSFPGNSSNLSTTLKQAVSYAKSNDIPVPADATKAL